MFDTLKGYFCEHDCEEIEDVCDIFNVEIELMLSIVEMAQSGASLREIWEYIWWYIS